jgi:hypothetical protein
VEGVPERPYLYFYISMGVAMFALGIMGLAFVRGGVEHIVGGKRGNLDEALVDESSGSAVVPKAEGDHSWEKIKRLLTNPLILSLMLWSFFYVSPIYDSTDDRPEQNPALVDIWYVACKDM